MFRISFSQICMENHHFSMGKSTNFLRPRSDSAPTGRPTGSPAQAMVLWVNLVNLGNLGGTIHRKPGLIWVFICFFFHLSYWKNWVSLKKKSAKDQSNETGSFRTLGESRIVFTGDMDFRVLFLCEAFEFPCVSTILNTHWVHCRNYSTLTHQQ